MLLHDSSKHKGVRVNQTRICLAIIQSPHGLLFPKDALSTQNKHMDFFVFFAILMAVLMAVIFGGLIYSGVQRTSLKVGDLVRTTFTGCPAVLTTALWGPKGEYTYDPPSDPYGFHGTEDAANGLHCDVFGSKGTYSSWISSNGANYKTLTELEWMRLGAQRYFSNQTCETNDDCKSQTFVSCGPGFFNALATSSSWQFGDPQPDSVQCPTVARCSLCLNGKDCTTLTINSTETGTCLLTSSKNEFTAGYSCTTIYPGSDFRYCNTILNTKTGLVLPAAAQNACSPINDYSFSTFCSGTNYDQNYYCKFAPGNADCLYGQSCTANDPNYSLIPTKQDDSVLGSDFMCSGTVLPDVVINLPWIAEGIITEALPDNKFNIDWRRVNLQYTGVGPSDLMCPDGIEPCRRTREVTEDRSWKYNDCRFVLSDIEYSYTTTPPVRHYEVKRALLGTSVSNPTGLGIFSSTNWIDSADYDFYLLSVSMYVSNQNFGTINSTPIEAQGISNWRLNNQPFLRTQWNLTSVNVRGEDLDKLFFYSILPVASSTLTDKFHKSHHTAFVNKQARHLLGQTRMII